MKFLNGSCEIHILYVSFSKGGSECFKMLKECESSVEEAKALVPTANEEAETKSAVKFSGSLRVLLLVAGLFCGIFILMSKRERETNTDEINTGNMTTNDSKSILIKDIEVNEKEDSYHGLDIFLIGFPKCGTGTIRDLFSKSNEIAMLGHENGDLFRKGSSKRAFSILESNFERLFKYGQSHERRHGHTPTVLNATKNAFLKRAVKNPNGIVFFLFLKHSY